MAMHAPELPTTETLLDMHQLTDQAEIEIALARERIGGILSGREAGLIGIAGPCAMNHQVEIIAQEGEELRELTAENEGLYVAHRVPVWKPRTNPEDWHGRETTDPEGAHQTLIHQANHGTGTSIEIANLGHAERYAHATVIDWFGGRNINKPAMMAEVAMHDTGLPLAVKNGLDGKIDEALNHVETLNQLRGEDAAPVILLYRGGESAKTPEAWEGQYREALIRTGGKMIVDIAHGSEMAHDPNGNFKKSSEGQIAAMEHVIAVAENDEELPMPAGIMMEASDAESPTDPHMPMHIAIDGLKRLHAIRISRASAKPEAYDPWTAATSGMLESGHL